MTIRGISIFISGIAGTWTEGMTMRRVPIVPGRMIVGSLLFSGVRLTVRELWSRRIVSDISPSSFLLMARTMSPDESTFSPSTAVIMSPAFNPALAAGLFSLTEVISKPPSLAPK